jgi:predicted DNA binding CopG/RHH family protein
MQHTQHSAEPNTKGAQGVSSAAVSASASERFTQLNLRVPQSIRWDLKAIAASKKTNYGQLIVSILEEYIAREKAAA